MKVLNGFKSLRFLLLAVVVAVAAGGMSTTAAWADQLDDLRRSGAVGERYDGLAVARDSSASGFVQSVNAKRAKIYQDRAAKEGITAEQVGMVYAQQIRRSAPAGTWFLSRDGTWSRK